MIKYCKSDSLKVYIRLIVWQFYSHTVIHSDSQQVCQSYSQTVWLRYSDSLTVWQSDSLTVWNADCPTVYQSNTLVVWLFDSLNVWQFESLTVCHSDCLTVWQSGSPTVWQFDSLTVRQSDSLTVACVLSSTPTLTHFLPPWAAPGKTLLNCLGTCQEHNWKWITPLFARLWEWVRHKYQNYYEPYTVWWDFIIIV